MNEISIPDAIGGGGLLIGLATLALFVVQVQLLRRELRRAEQTFADEQASVRSRATLEFITTTMERRHVLLSEVPEGTNVEELAQILVEVESDDARRRTLHRYISFYESLSVGVNTNALDIEIVDRAWGSSIIRTFTSYAPYIRARRAIINQPTLFMELEQLAANLQRRRGALSRSGDGA